MKWDISDFSEWGSKEHEPGAAIIEAGNSQYFSTGNWRVKRPVRDDSRCSHCMLCYVYCPDSSIVIEDEKMAGFDLEHCKGCGICAKECPRDCIEMADEDGEA